MGHLRRAEPVRCTSAYRPIALDWLQLSGAVGGPADQYTDPPHPFALLPAGREWPCGSAAEKGDELASIHVAPQQMSKC